jgi:hypothetical protein
MSTFSPNAVGANILGKGFGVCTIKDGVYLLTGHNNHALCRIEVSEQEHVAWINFRDHALQPVSCWSSFWTFVEQTITADKWRLEKALELL